MTVGYLSYRTDHHLSASEERLVRDLAGQLGGALHARLLREDLQRARERLVLAREEERRRLRRDLHDGIGPALAGLTLKTETARAMLPPGADRASRQLNDLSEEIRRTVMDVRRLVEGLRPPALDELGPAAAIEGLAERIAGRHGMEVGVDVRLGARRRSPELETALYRIVQEALNNAIKHAGAGRLEVKVVEDVGVVRVEVADDGRGFDPTAQHAGFGLLGMRERVALLHGELEVLSSPDGTRVVAALPS